MDIFAQIAKNGIGGRLDLLSVPEPIPFHEYKIPLTDSSFTPMPVPEQITTPEQLNEALKHLREQYVPFLQTCSPQSPATRTTFPLKNFEWYQIGKEEDTRTTITLPHYGRPLGNGSCVYTTHFQCDVPEGRHAFLVITGADYKAQVFVNEKLAGVHEGFFATFEFDITDLLCRGDNLLRIELQNDYVMQGSKAEGDTVRHYGDKIYAATGLGFDDPDYGWNHCPPAMGLFDKVYIEVRDAIFVEDLFTRTLDDEIEVWAEVASCTYHQQEVTLDVSLYGENHEQTVLEHFEITPGTKKIIGLGDTFTENYARREDSLNAKLPLPLGKGRNLFKFTLPRTELKTWTPDTPFLYRLSVSVKNTEGVLCDTKASTFGVRTFTQDLTAQRKGMFYLNGEKIRLRGANTMGFEQQDVLHGDMEQLIDDILLAKLCNMNFWRLTQRPVQQEIYDMCDRLGLMTQTDLPLFGVLRRSQFCEALRQAEEMERHVRRHPCNIMVTYINEPSPNADNFPHMNCSRAELEQFFMAADAVVHLSNPDRVIKHSDGDYDPPNATLPDSHCYCLWYNGHGIDIGKLHKGYWLPTKPGWYYGCGEYGCEGLEAEATMMENYPEKWLPDKDGKWHPDQIPGGQTGDFYHFFYEKQNSMGEWIAESQKFQALATRLMTETFRRDPRMVTFALHLFIDAFPSGWMKTIMDCERRPKTAYFAYRSALSPVLISLRTDRFFYSGGEEISVESWLCNDTHREGDYTMHYELWCENSAEAMCENTVCLHDMDVDYGGTITFPLKHVEKRATYTLRAWMLDKNSPENPVISYNELPLTVLPAVEFEEDKLIIKKTSEMTEQDLKKVQSGKILWIDAPNPGNYNLSGTSVCVKESGMAPMHFAARDTGHPWVSVFTPDDFRFWYDEESDVITPLAESTFTASNFVPVLENRNLDDNGSWQEEMLLGEKSLGAGHIIWSQIPYARLRQHPVGRMLLQQITEMKGSK